MKRSPLLLALALTLVPAACGSTDPAADDAAPPGSSEDGADPDQPGSSDDGAAGSPSGAADGTQLALPEPREVRDGVQDATPRPFERARADETDGSLHVVYSTGVEPCAVLGDIEVEATAEEVTVTLHEGYLPEDGEQPTCIEIAEEVSARIPLDEPLDGRTLIDGASGEPVPVEVIELGDAAAS